MMQDENVDLPLVNKLSDNFKKPLNEAVLQELKSSHKPVPQLEIPTRKAKREAEVKVLPEPEAEVKVFPEPETEAKVFPEPELQVEVEENEPDAAVREYEPEAHHNETEKQS